MIFMELLALLLLVFVIWYLLILKSNTGRSYSYIEEKCKANNTTVNLISFIFLLLFDKGVLALLIYRVSNRIDSKLAGKIFTRIGDLLTGIEIYYNADIGKYVNIWHGNGVVIGQSAVIGDGCVILQQVTIGGGFVKIGKNCKFGAGAKILGNISLENDVVVAANSVVTKSFSGNKFIAGIPAKVISEIDNSSDIVFGTKQGS